MCPDKALTHEPWPEPLGQWGEAIRAATPAARATCCSGIMQLDTAIRMMEHREFSTLTTPMAADHRGQHWHQPEWKKMDLLILFHRCLFVFAASHPYCVLKCFRCSNLGPFQGGGVKLVCVSGALLFCFVGQSREKSLN